LINFVDATNDANHYTKPPPKKTLWFPFIDTASSYISVPHALLTVP